jgi:hypothetical protein
MVGRFWKPHIGQAVGSELDLMVLIGGAKEVATLMFAEKLDNFQHSKWFIPESRSCALNSRHENLKTRIPNRLLGYRPQGGRHRA